MKNADKEITLYNFFTDDSTGYDTCKRISLKGVSAFVQTQVSVSKEGLASADIYTVRIPTKAVAEKYVTPQAYKALQVKDGYFTLAKGDKIVLCNAEEETVTSAYLESKYGNDMVMTITGVTDNRDKQAAHWKVTGE